MTKITLDNLSTTLSTSAATTINSNNDAIEVALEKTLSRDGTTPNQMEADLDLNHNDIINVDQIDVTALYIGGSLITPSSELFEIPPGSIDTPLLKDGAVTSDKLANKSVVESKIADLLANKIIYVSATRSEMASALIDTNRYQVSYLNEGKRAGIFRWKTGNYLTRVSADTRQGVYIPSAVDPTGASGCWVRETHEITPEMFGAVGDATNIGVGTDDTLAIDAWLTILKDSSTKFFGYIPSTYRYNPSAAWDLTNINWGLILRGNSKNGSGFYLDAGKSLGIEGANNFYSHFEDFRVLCNVAGPAVRIGKNDFSDAFNGLKLTLTINNNSLDNAAEGLRLNYVLQSDIFCTINCGGTGRPGEPTTPGHGSSMVLRQATFNRFMVALGQANTGLYMTGGFSFANTFEAIDIEEVDTAVKIDSANVANNLFVSGQILGTTTFNCTAGRNNVFDIGCNPVFYGGGSIGTNLVGIELRSGAVRAHAPVVNPAMPASTVYFKNSTGERRQIVVWGGTYTQVDIKATDGGVVGLNPSVTNGTFTFLLHPNWEIAITYSSVPSWRWYPG